MGDIVATIQAAQYELISAEPDQVLVLDGGPGTGKTAVALHRLSWLLANTPGLRADNVLVVGPHPTFTRYIARVLPSLGDDSVAQRDITQLAPDVHRGRSEPVEVARLKGDARMAGLLARALTARIGVPEQLERLMVDGRFVSVPGSEIAEALASARTAPGPYARRRALFRDRLVQLLLDRGTSPAVGRIPAVEGLVERLWPQLSPAAFLRDLFGSRDRLLAAGGSEFTAQEVAGLRRRAADRLSEETWTPDDLPLLDEAEHLITGAPQRYAHIVVDEAQDLSPMQLRSIARRSSTGGFTLAGDLAQSTGPWARDSWDSVTAELAGAAPATLGRLRYGYRVPRQVYDLAAILLPMAAPGTEPPEVVRDGPGPPGIHRVDPAERAARAVGLAIAHAAERRFTGIVCPASCRPAVEAALAANGVSWSSADRGELGLAINLVSPHEAKGLEFDAVVVVEPEEIVASDQRGHRLLYVALTRTIGYLDIVCAGEPLPMAMPAPTEPEPVPRKDVRVDTSATVQDYAEEIILWVRDTVPRPLWAAVLREAAKELGRRPD
jgi:DNA helicase IV